LLEDGANVIINGRNATGVEQAVVALNKRFGTGRALPLVTDMSVAGSENIAAAAYPSIDILVNNMGTYALSDSFPPRMKIGRACSNSMSGARFPVALPN
jgi:3-oxoacyl-[acyl-carrier protein] reductase